jgi:hypothetical protein
LLPELGPSRAGKQAAEPAEDVTVSLDCGRVVGVEASVDEPDELLGWRRQVGRSLSELMT